MSVRKRYKILCLISVITLLFDDSWASGFGRVNKAVSQAHYDSTGPNHIFKNGDEGYTCFRIPALVRTQKGTLLAFAEGRKRGCSDTGDIDLLLRRSVDGGRTWGKMQVVWDDSENTCGNPAPVVDRETGTIFLLTTWNLGTDHEKEIISGESEDTRRVFVTFSDDDGMTWRPMTEITKSVKRKGWSWYATGPCSGIQLTRSKYAGRLIIPCNHIVAESKTGYSHIIYSDNHGKTWKLGGISPLAQTNESTAVELSSGDVMLNMRNYNREKRYRQVAISHNGGNSWATAYLDSALIEPICQGSLTDHKFPGDERLYHAFANPSSKTKRLNMTIKISNDDGRSWTVSKTVYEGPSAYSGLVSFPDGGIGILYEAGKEKPYEGIAYEVFSASDLIDRDGK